MASRGSEDGAEVIIGLFRSPGLAQGHYETNSAPGLSPFLLLSPIFSLPHPYLLLPPSLILSFSWGLLSQQTSPLGSHREVKGLIQSNLLGC